MKILIIDNDTSIGTTMKSALGLNPSYEVDIALSAKEGLDKMRAQKYDLVLLDFMMPEISGIDLCKTMVADPELKKMSVILVSALPITSKVFQETNGNFQELGVIKGLLEKPFGVSDLLDKVAQVIKK
ncbi:MAG TPA: response regulator [bacterium]|nr:response regulator [bacterium]HPT30014.1 response regulator [bacterium]